MGLLEEIERACKEADDPKLKAQTKKIKEGRAKLKKAYNEGFSKLVKEVMDENQ